MESDPDFAALMDAIQRLLALALPRFDAEGKSYLTLAFGCTGGRHRSVFVAERLADWIRGLGRAVHVQHRDLADAAASVETAGEKKP